WKRYVSRPKPPQVPESPVSLFPAAAVPMTVGAADTTGPPAADASEPAGSASSVRTASAVVARRLARGATSQGYGSGRSEPHGIRRRDDANGRVLPAHTGKGAAPREDPRFDRRLMGDAELA